MNVEEKNKIKEMLEDRVKTAIKLRFSSESLDSNAAPSEVLEELLKVRRRLDRLEVVLLEVSAIRSQLAIEYALAKSVSEDAWDTETRESRKSKAAYGNDYSSAKEREAEIRPKIFKQIREERMAEEVSTAANEALKAIRIAYNGLDSTRQDLLAWLKNTSYESYLERQ